MHHGIHIEHLSKRYGQGDTAVLALKDVNMHVAPGEVVGLIRPIRFRQKHPAQMPGCGDRPHQRAHDAGRETDFNRWPWQVRDLRALRRDKIGFVFQAPYLIPFLNVIDNVALLPMLAGVPNAGPRARRRWNCSQRWTYSTAPSAMPSATLGWRAARVAIARGLVEPPAGDPGR